MSSSKRKSAEEVGAKVGPSPDQYIQEKSSRIREKYQETGRKYKCIGRAKSQRARETPPNTARPREQEHDRRQTEQEPTEEGGGISEKEAGSSLTNGAVDMDMQQPRNDGVCKSGMSAGELWKWRVSQGVTMRRMYESDGNEDTETLEQYDRPLCDAKN